MQLHGILETVLYAEDLEAAEAFYRDVLALELYSKEPARHLFFRCDNGMFLVFNPRETSRPDYTVAETHVIPHGTTGAGHMAFRVAEDELDAWRQRLNQWNIRIETEIAWPQGGHSIYFRDPAGNSLELATPRLWGLPDVGKEDEGEGKANS